MKVAVSLIATFLFYVWSDYYIMRNRLKNSVVSFLLSFISVTLIFGISGYIGGDFSLFEGDDYQQYLVFITDFLNCIKNSGSIWYSFGNYIGSGNILTVAYYCLSPFNICFLLCGENFYLAFYLVIALKISLAASLFCYFISEYSGNNNFYHIVGSLFYALCGYSVTWYFNIMWLDALYILPLLISFIVRFVRKKRNAHLGLIIVYVYLFITNFYMGYIVGVFSAVFFVSYLLYENEYTIKNKLIYYIRTCCKYAGCVILAIGISAGLLMPTAGFLSEHIAQDNSTFKTLSLNFFDIFNSMFLGVFQTMDNKVPLLYAGIPTAILVIFMFINKRVDLKEKIFWGVQILFYVVCMIYLPLYKFIHAFDYPNYYGYRFSFVVVFLLVAISCISLNKVDGSDGNNIKAISVVAVIFYSFMMTFQSINFGGNRLNNQECLIINTIFIVIWYALYKINYYSIIKNKVVQKLMIIVIASVEVIINGYICINNTDFVHIEKNLINGWYYSEKQAIDDIKNEDQGFYRIYVNNDVNANSSKMFGFNGLNTFSSADNYDLRMALSRLGHSTSNRYMRTNCSVPVFDSLFSIKYYVDLPAYEDYISTYVDSNNFMPATITQNEKALSLGYMVGEGILEYSLEDNTFDNLENLCQAMTNKEAELFDDIALNDEYLSLQNYSSNVIDNRTYYSALSDLYKGEAGVAFILPDYSDDRYMEFSYNAPASYVTYPNVFTDEEGAYHSKLLSEGGVYKMGKLDDSNYIKVATSSSPSKSFYIDSINIAEYCKEAFEPIYADLAGNQYDIKVYNTDYISGTVVATEEKPLLFTTIPYDPEWHIYVDGQPITTLYRVVGDAFMAVRLTPGEHTVTFEYIEKWSNEGMIITLISITVFCVLVLMVVFKKSGDVKSNKPTNVANNKEVIGDSK